MYKRFRRKNAFILQGRGRWALVTGGCSGIGFCIARRLAQLGLNLIIWDVDALALLDATSKLQQVNKDIFVQHRIVDVTDEDAVRRAHAALVERNVHVSVLINNAGVVAGRTVVDAVPAEVRRTFEVNTLSLWWTLKHFLPAMIAKKDGYVVTLSSVMGVLGSARLTDYSASKWAALGLHDSLRIELYKSGVKSLVVCPGPVKTKLFDGIYSNCNLIMNLVLWVAPMLEPQDVANRLVKAMENGDEVLFIPWWMNPASKVLKLMPLCVYDYVIRVVGGAQGMDGFCAGMASRKQL